MWGQVEADHPLLASYFIQHSVLLFTTILVQQFTTFLDFQVDLFLSILHGGARSFQRVQPGFYERTTMGVSGINLG